MASRFDRIAIHNWDGVAVLDLGQIDIWDGADLSLLRETLVDQIERKKQRLIGVNMSWVKYIPSGFFGMLFDWYERGTAIFLYSPQPNVANMVWFKQFFVHQEDGRYILDGEAHVVVGPEDEADWNEPADWQEMLEETPASSTFSRD